MSFFFGCLKQPTVSTGPAQRALKKPAAAAGTAKEAMEQNQPDPPAPGPAYCTGGNKGCTTIVNGKN